MLLHTHQRPADVEELVFDTDEEEAHNAGVTKTDRPQVRCDESADGDGDDENETSDDNDDEEEDGDADDNRPALTPKHTRSGTSFYSNGVKMRPTERNRHDRPRYGKSYLQRRKTKLNLLKNRSAMGHKTRVRKLRHVLH